MYRMNEITIVFYAIYEFLICLWEYIFLIELYGCFVEYVFLSQRLKFWCFDT